MRILITGGAGFIGSNLARSALSRGHEVVVLDNLSTGYRANIAGLDVEFIQADVRDAEALNVACRAVDSIVHLAALGSVPRSVEDPLASHEANATGTLDVLIAARRNGVEHVAVASSSSVYGRNPALPKHEREWVRPMSPYAVSKLASEQYALAFGDTYGLATDAFRFFNVYGPRQRAGHPYAAVIPIFMNALLVGAPLPINGDGTQSRDFTYVETVCEVLIESAERHEGHPEPINLAFGTRTSLLGIVDHLQKLSPEPIELEFHPPRVGDVPHSQADNTKLRSLFPDVRPVNLTDGLARTFAWFRDEYSDMQK